MYKSERANYVVPQMTPFDGTMSLTWRVSLEHDLQTSSNGLLRNLATPDQSPSESIVRREELLLLASYLERLSPD